MAKMHVGAAVREAIAHEPFKRFGSEPRISAVCSGDGVPDWLGRIYLDVGTRTRLGLLFLKDHPLIRLHIGIDFDKPK